ncbi:MAG: cytochrome bc complex cytochrome b subunit [Candidatus Baltobacteraceae bacterium]
MIARLMLWLDDRLGTSAFASRALRKAFPDHWSFMLGEIALYAFAALLVTGIFLGFLFNDSNVHQIYRGPYAPLDGVSVSGAYASALRISFETQAGLVIRQIHHWAALLFCAAIVTHMSRIFFTGAFRKPRDINWTVGLTLLLLALAAGFTGYSLPDDLLSGTGLRIAASIAMTIPFIGIWIESLFFGGPFPAPQMTGRLFFTHVFLLPGLILGLVALHMAILWHQKHAQFRGAGRTEQNVVGSPLWPNYALKSLGLGFATFAVLAILGGFFQINPIWQYGPYDPAQVASPAQPDWYVGWLDGALRLGLPIDVHVFGHTIPAAFLPGVIFPLVAFTLLYLWPWIERRFTHDAAVHNLLDLPIEVPWRTATGVAFLAVFLVTTLAASDDVQARLMGVPVESLTLAYQVLVVAFPVFCWFLVYQLCREFRSRAVRRGLGERPIVEFVRSAEGGFQEHEPSNVP